MNFVKYEGAGNDFILVNHWDGIELADTGAEHIARLCDRHFGIGADGLMIIERDPDYDFFMRYFNSDGHPSSMCGNGGRCIVAYAHRLRLIGVDTTFRAVDGPHRAKLVRPDWVELEMHPTDTVRTQLAGCFIDTGSPHYVLEVEDVAAINVFTEGRRWRQHPDFAPGGSNVNFVQGDTSGLTIATYERGVEDETLACGTGVTAAALVAVWRQGGAGTYTVPVQAKGGKLEVRLAFDGQHFSDVWLCGPARQVFRGHLS
jgi:diaminopimelate epimerase